MKLKKYTYKQVIEMVNSLEGNDYTEVLTLISERRRKTERGGEDNGGRFQGS